MNPTSAHDDLHNPDVAHEHSDVAIGPLIGFAIGLFGVSVVVCVLMVGVFNVLDRRAAANDPQLSPLAVPAVQMPPTTADPYFGHGQGPQLVTNEPAVLHKQRSMEEKVLGSYGWVDEKAGIARMPISEAKKLLLQRGLPARSEGIADAGLGTNRAAFGESSSGRTITKANVDSEQKPEQTPEQKEPQGAPAQPATPHKGHGQ